jgi:TetR/AcrR family transcriptional regulator, repressor for neighboring sulfatase
VASDRKKSVTNQGVTKKAVRKRRRPEDAKALIMASARKLFAEHGPDAVGLKEVAADAGISHALISHYFGTYEALVECVFEEHIQTVREEFLRLLQQDYDNSPEKWLEHFFSALEQPLYSRLIAWSMLSKRAESDSFFPRRDQGLKRVADAFEARWKSDDKKTPGLARDDIEFLLLLVISAAFGYRLGRSVWWASLSKEPSVERDAWFREKIVDIIRSFSEMRGVPVPDRSSK